MWLYVTVLTDANETPAPKGRAVPWTHRQTIRLRHIDAAGVIFYPRLLEMTHEAYEALLDHLGQPLVDTLASGQPIAPIVRCEADYRRPMTMGMELTIEVSVVREGKSSYTMGYTFRDDAGQEMASVQVTHAAIDRETGRSVRLTEKMQQGLSALR